MAALRKEAVRDLKQTSTRRKRSAGCASRDNPTPQVRLQVTAEAGTGSGRHAVHGCGSQRVWQLPSGRWTQDADSSLRLCAPRSTCRHGPVSQQSIAVPMRIGSPQLISAHTSTMTTMSNPILSPFFVLLLLLLLLSSTVASSAAYMCMSDDDCELNGVCSVDMVCECDLGWKGGACSELDLQSAAFHTGYNLTAQGTSSWGGRIVRDPQDAQLHHLFAAEFIQGCGLDYWSPMSRIIRAESRSGPAGPYAFAQEVAATFAHNPTVVWSPADHAYLMYHIGCPVTPPSGCQSQSVACDGGNSENGESGISLRLSADLRSWKAVGQILSNDTNGSWDADTTNPSPLPLYSASNRTAAVLLAYRGCPFNCDGDELISLAYAASAAGPYTRLHSSPLFPNDNEDPFLWRDRRGHYHLLMHSLEPDGGFGGPRIGRHAFTRDFRQPWTFGNKTLAFNVTVQFETGETVDFYRRERPQLFFDDDEAMTPLYLSTGVQQQGSAASYTLIQPLGPAAAYEKRMGFRHAAHEPRMKE